MIRFDPSQERVLGLDASRHARVLGAPGTGKTRLLAEVYARALELPGWSESEVLALAPNRLAAASLRAGIETRIPHALGGAPARTPASLAFAVLAEAAAATGEPAPRLLTGTVQDEGIAATVERMIESEGATGALVPEVLRSPTFRAELREFWRVLDDFDLDPDALARRLDDARHRAASEAVTEAPDSGLLDRWEYALRLVAEAGRRLAEDRPAELSSSGLIREASRCVNAGRVAPPRLILVDDAQEIGEGELALIASCAAAGSRVWLFGDPDIATETFRGERARVLMDFAAELGRRGVRSEPEQVVVLETVHRHGAELRGFVRGLTSRLGSAGMPRQREASASAVERTGDEVRFATAASPSEQLGIIAHRLRARHLGLDGREPLRWGRMAVVCRSRTEASRLARGLAAHQVPTGVTAGGIVLREHRAVRNLIRLLQHALGLAAFSASDVLDLLAGPIGGLDPVAVRRLRGAVMLLERRDASDAGREARATDDVLLDAFAHPGTEPLVDSRGGRALRRLGRIAAAGEDDHRSGGTARETLWALWSTTKLADEWQERALNGRGGRADEAQRSLDATMGLFFALQRHEEQDSSQPIEQLLEELLESAVPEDSLAQRAQRDAVTVTTPQGTIGREFDLVAIVGAQDGAWPNTRARGSLLGAVALERWLRGGSADDPSRRDTIHDELRLYAQACSRACDELLVVAISDEDHHPSPFFGFGSAHLQEGMPSSRLTLRGATAAMRRRLVADPEDGDALGSLVELARSGAPGAHPDEWYGVSAPSTDAPLHDLGAPESRVPVSPSQMERAETCPLDWVIGALGGGSGTVEMNLGTLVHHAFETAQSDDPEQLLAGILREWRKLPFDADWDAERALGTAAEMAAGLADYLREFEASDRELVGRETGFNVPLGEAELRGKVDRLELRRRSEGVELAVLDLKTGANPPSGPATERHAQLQAYQLAIETGAFSEALEAAEGIDPDGVSNGGARLLFVHPKATKGRGFVERAQAPLSEEARNALVQRVAEIARVMAAESFTARVEHHCSDSFSPGECRLHIIEAVSHA